jgi:hypothetical protein
MTIGETCPRCSEALVVSGTITSQPKFRPRGLKLFSLSLQFPEVPVAEKGFACASCGLVCSEIDAPALRQKLRDLGNRKVQRFLDEAEAWE